MSQRTPSPERAMKLEPTADLIVTRETFQPDSRFPDVVRQRVMEMKEKDRLLEMWRTNKSEPAFIPGTQNARTMKIQARLRAKLAAKEEVTRYVTYEEFVKPIKFDSTPLMAQGWEENNDLSAQLEGIKI